MNTLFPMLDRLVPFALFALYLVTAVRLCTYTSWVRAGAPNPFLPQSIRVAVSRDEVARLMEAELRMRGHMI